MCVILSYFTNSVWLFGLKILFYLQVFVSTLNNFLQKDKITAWEALPVDNQRRSLTKLLHTAEQATLLMSQNLKKTTQLDANSSDIGKIKKINLSYTLDVGYTKKFFLTIMKIRDAVMWNTQVLICMSFITNTWLSV